MLQAGAAEVVITPPVGTRLDGYSGRVGGAVGVHDDLHARALVVDDGATKAAIVVCDLVGIDRRLAAGVREIVHDATGIAREHVMVAATHTHAGPAGLRADMDGALTEMMARTIAGAVVQAHGSLRPVVLKAGAGTVDSVSRNRRDPAWPRDDGLRVLLFDSPDPRDGPVASIVNFACHPTVLFSTNMHISADYPGAAVATVKKVLGEAPALFLNGACANVNPVWTEQEFAEVERVGSIVGAEAARRLQELRPLGQRQRTWNIRWDEVIDAPVNDGELIDEPRIRVMSRVVDVPLRALDPPDVYGRRLDDLARRHGEAHDVETRRKLMEEITFLRGARGVAEQLGARSGSGMLHPEVQAISFSDRCALLALPGEFFAETAEQIRAAAGVPHLLISCYANHHVFYVVPKDAWEQGGYEPGVAVLDETAEETFRLAAIDLLRAVTG
jgi:hypothetical protein